MEKYFCAKCGNVGELPDGSRCDCIYSMGADTQEGVSCMSVPEAYRGVTFDSSLLPVTNTGHYYQKYMQDLYLSIISIRLKNKNLFISSPVKSGKTVFAYSCIERLFRKDVATFPYFDILELASIMKAVDIGKQPALIDDMEVEPLNVYKAPYLFVKMTSELNFAVFGTMAKLVDRRTRRGNVTDRKSVV